MHLKLIGCFISLFAILAPLIAQVPGELDIHFGHSGIWTVDHSGPYKDKTSVHSFLQPNGKILISYALTDQSQEGFVINRLTTNGILDSTFGVQGTFTVYEKAHSVHITEAAEGGYLLAMSYFPYESRDEVDLLIMKLTYEGKLDPSFGTKGRIEVNHLGDESLSKVLVDESGKIWLCGESQIKNSPKKKIMFLRLTAEGAIDETFGKEGALRIDVGKNPALMDAEVLPDGALVGVGYAKKKELRDIMVTKLTNSGILDSTFGENGIKYLHVGKEHNYGMEVEIQGSDHLIIGGHAKMEEGTDFDLVVLRLMRNGSMDKSFGVDGVQFIDHGKVDYLSDMLLMSDGNILLAGQANKYFSISRLSPIGIRDSSYSQDGYVDLQKLKIGGKPYDKCYRIHLMNNQSIVMTGVLNSKVSAICMKGNPHIPGLSSLSNIHWNQESFADVKQIPIRLTSSSSLNVYVYDEGLRKAESLSSTHIKRFVQLQISERLGLLMVEDGLGKVHTYVNGRYVQTFENGLEASPIVQSFP